MATKDLQMNDIILSELPLAIGCSNRNGLGNFCVGCYLQSIYYPESSKLVFCRGCNWQICKEGCPGVSDPERHAQECAILKGGKDARFHMMGEVLPIRCMLVQNRNPEAWEMMKEMGERALKERDPK